MRDQPTEDDKKDVERLNAEPWQLELLTLNPDFTSWGPGEDRDEDEINVESNWMTTLSFKTWPQFTKWAKKSPDDRNEIVHFYFEILRDSTDCAACDATGFSPPARALEDAFYEDTGEYERWCDAITLDEAQALVNEGRLGSFVNGEWRNPDVVDDDFVERVNRANTPRWVCGHPESLADAMLRLQFNHDAISRLILIETRGKRLGFKAVCDTCDGHGEVFTAKAAHVRLVLWLLHPGKGASRFLAIELLTQDQVPAALALLSKSAKRNADRFAKVDRMRRETL
jgi:hypothetical protein